MSHLEIYNFIYKCSEGIVHASGTKTKLMGLREFKHGLTQINLCSHRRVLEAQNFGLKKKRICIILIAKANAVAATLFSPRQISALLMTRPILDITSNNCCPSNVHKKYTQCTKVIIDLVKESNDQEMAQSERNSHSKTGGGENLN